MKKKLIVHIGAGKTGSSAIQKFLSLNCSVLAEHGVLIPGCKLDLESECLGEQIWFFQNGIGNNDFADSVQRRLSRLHKHMCEHELHTLVVSAENLINPQEFEKLFLGLEGMFDITIVCYIRRQDDYMISAWQQWYLKAYDSFDDYRLKLGHRIDWHAALHPWKEKFGKDNVKVSVYEKESLVNGNVIDDFTQLLGLEITGMQPVVERINKSIDEKFNWIANKYRKELFADIHDNEFYLFLHYSFGDKAFKKYKGSSLLTLSQRKNILAMYAESNEKVVRDYTPDRKSTTLFREPTESDVYLTDQNCMEGEMDYLLVGMFGMYKRMRKSAA